MNWNKTLFKEMVQVALRAPSVHNVQPWAVEFRETGFYLYQSKERRLFIGDPKLHDNDVSLGCFLELCRMFLETKGIGLKLEKDESRLKKNNEDVFESRFAINLNEIPAREDRLFSYVFKRKSYRGLFDKSQNEKNTPAYLENETLKIKWIMGSEEMKKWADIYDESSVQINRMPGYFKELVHWIRFSEKNPKYFQDGLTREALALGKIEGLIGSLLFKESIFNFLSKCSMEKILLTEAPQIRSSHGLLVIFAPSKLTPIEMGMAFVRLWLDLTSQGLYACPLSALVDFTQSREFLNSMKPDNDMICLNVLRFGKVSDESKIYTSPRLDVDRIIIE